MSSENTNHYLKWKNERTAFRLILHPLHISQKHFFRCSKRILFFNFNEVFGKNQTILNCPRHTVTTLHLFIWPLHCCPSDVGREPDMNLRTSDPPHSAGGLRESARFCGFNVSAATHHLPRAGPDYRPVQTLIIPVLTRVTEWAPRTLWLSSISNQLSEARH